MTLKRSLFSVLTVTLVTACTPSVPSEYIQPGDMEDILYDYHVGQAIVKAEHPGEQRNFGKTEYFLRVLQKHGITEADFDSSMVYYYSHLGRLKEIYTDVNERLSDEAKSLGAAVGAINRYSQYSASGDTANIWKGASDVLLIPYPSMNRFDFTIKADSSFYKGDSFVFQFTSEYIWQAGMKDAVACVVAKYEGDSIVQTVNHISVSGIAQVRIPANNENRLKEMQGYIYLGKGNVDNDNSKKLMFISQLQLIRFHNKDIKNDKSDKDIKNDLKSKDIKNDLKNKDIKNDKDNKKDSLPRTVNPKRPMPDDARIGNLKRPRHQMVPAAERISVR